MIVSAKIFTNTFIPNAKSSFESDSKNKYHLFTLIINNNDDNYN